MRKEKVPMISDKVDEAQRVDWQIVVGVGLSLALSAFDSFNCTKAQGRQLCFLTCSFLFMWCVCWEQLTVSPIIKQEGSWVVQEICATCSIRRIGILEEASEVLPPDSRILDVEVYYRRSTSSLTVAMFISWDQCNQSQSFLDYARIIFSWDSLLLWCWVGC